MANFDNETEKVCTSGQFWNGDKKVWISGKFWQEDWKSMKKWPILRRRLNKYENLATYDKETEKVWKIGQFWQGDWKSIKNWPILEGDWKSMKIWQIMTRGLKKYENLGCEVLEGSTRFYTLSILCKKDFSCFPKFHNFSISLS